MQIRYLNSRLLGKSYTMLVNFNYQQNEIVLAPLDDKSNEYFEQYLPEFRACLKPYLGKNLNEIIMEEIMLVLRTTLNNLEAANGNY